MKITPNKIKWLLRLYPPYLGAGIKVDAISDDWMSTKVSMKLRWYNRNYVKTHFGGSLFAMTDPHYMLMLSNILGRNYVVWDKEARIDFIKPGTSKVSVNFKLTDEIINEIKHKTQKGDKFLPTFELDILNEAGETVAKVYKTLYIRKKDKPIK
jgi:acyl-coenzyme A thioesterase PaaI-like protein